MILMNDFLAEPEQLKSAITARLSAAAQSGWYILGKEVEALRMNGPAFVEVIMQLVSQMAWMR